ncbi:hypothetical protein IC006_2433 [Sulfuracidifex tepidarius]|uniref:Transposase IS4-like domain-containing protein n=1 Tax=Sulfuracidifex tepidarius TaxID=1294262 RepID=A0A510E733_9CREN|nr:hypothetical protein IC006_2433 [Sulfuracidifex tepidarius]BBG27880.1 hypothetical protein IC007_2435 [Sulfuracidifex tepidarius]
MESAVNTVKGRGEGKEVDKSYGGKAYYSDKVYDLSVDVAVPPKRNASSDRSSGAKRKGVEEFKRLGYRRWRDGKGKLHVFVESLFSAVKLSVRALGPPVSPVRSWTLSSSPGLTLP